MVTNKIKIVSERVIQISIIEWSNYSYIDPRDPNKGKINDYLFHIPNGGYRNKIEAFNFKRMGVKSGIPDLFFAYPSKDKHGMFLEIKSQKGVLNTNQNNFFSLMQQLNYKTHIIKTLDQAIDSFYDYLRD